MQLVYMIDDRARSAGGDAEPAGLDIVHARIT
jgi:hypothetical protein